MLYLTLAIFAAAIVALDQLTKYLTVANISLGDTVPVLDGVFHFTYVQNTGAAFSMLEGKMDLSRYDSDGNGTIDAIVAKYIK